MYREGGREGGRGGRPPSISDHQRHNPTYANQRTQQTNEGGEEGCADARSRAMPAGAAAATDGKAAEQVHRWRDLVRAVGRGAQKRSWRGQTPHPNPPVQQSDSLPTWQIGRHPPPLCSFPSLQVIKTWGNSVELPAVTKEEAQEAYLDTTSATRALTPPVGVAVAARDDMLKDRFNYVANNLNPSSQYVVMGGKGAVAPAAIGQGSFLIAGLCVLLGAVGSVVYVRTQWGVKSPKELGDRLREKGAAKREALERSKSASLVRTISSTAETSVKENVDLVRRPSQHVGAHFTESFKGAPRAAAPSVRIRPCLPSGRSQASSPSPIRLGTLNLES